jgi:hypothetical protein
MYAVRVEVLPHHQHAAGPHKPVEPAGPCADANWAHLFITDAILLRMNIGISQSVAKPAVLAADANT